MIKSSKSTSIDQSEDRDTAVGARPTIQDFSKQDFNGTASLRPSTIDDYVGQEKIITQLKLILKSARLRETIPEHVLLYGQPGLGKTTLAMIIAQEMGVDIRIVSAPALQKVGDVVNILLNLDVPTVVFVDEIHRLRTQVEELLYSAMEDRKIDLVMGKGTGVNTVRMDLPPFMLVGATTQFGKLTKPLRDRFPTVFKLEAYTEAEMVELVQRNCLRLSIRLTDEAILEVTRRSRGVPRVANNILKRFLDLMTVHHANTKHALDLEDAKQFLAEMGIYEHGFTTTDLAYLQALANGSVSLKTLSGILQEEVITIEEVIEPYLLHKGLVDKDSSGRKLTPKGYEYLGLAYRANGRVELL
jgi:holliday junction DNA helicase RuvB